MRNIYLLLLLIIPLNLIGQSDNFLGGGISYSIDTAQNGDYIIRLDIYRDCTKNPFSSTQQVSIASSGCATETVTLQLKSFNDITPVFPNQNSPCQSGSNPVPAGAEEYIYEGKWTPNVNCSQFRIEWTTCCRGNGISTATSTPDAYLYAILNTDYPNNSIQLLAPILLPFHCVDQMPLNDFYGLSDLEGDSIKIDYTYCLDDQKNNLTYIPPYDLQHPVSITNNLVDKVQQGVRCYLVKEYRNGQVIGEYLIEKLINVTDCNFNISGINQLNKAVNMAVSPNPFNNELNFYFELGQPEVVQIEVFDIMGKLFHQEEIRLSFGKNSKSLSTEAFPPGIYNVQVTIGEYRMVEKVLKVN